MSQKNYQSSHVLRNTQEQKNIVLSDTDTDVLMEIIHEQENIVFS